MTDEKNDPFEEKVKQALDSSIDDIDPRVLANLNRARHQAMDESSKTKALPPWMRWGSASGFVTAAVLAALWMGDPSMTPTKNLEDLELLTFEEDLELMEEIDFVAWLIEQEENHAG